MKKFLLLFVLLMFSFALHAVSVSFEYITVLAVERDKQLALNLAEELYHDIERFQQHIGTYQQIPITIVMARDDKDYATMTERGSGIIEFSLAFYDHRDKMIYMKNPRDIRNYNTLRKVLLHEYIHRFIDYHMDNVPLWFHEGMAVFFSEDLSFDRYLNLIVSNILSRTRPLEEMKYRYPKQRMEWESFYAKSALAIRYLYTNYSHNFFSFWQIAQKESDFNAVFVQSFYITPDMFSNMFDEYLTKQFRTEIILASTGLLWVILPLIFLIALVRRSIKNKKIREKWEEDNIDREMDYDDRIR